MDINKLSTLIGSECESKIEGKHLICRWKSYNGMIFTTMYISIIEDLDEEEIYKIIQDGYFRRFNK